MADAFFNVDVRDIERVKKKLFWMGKTINGEMSKTMRQAMDYVEKKIPPYPPPPPTSKYTRTYKLKNSYFTKVETIGGDVVGKVGSQDVDYAPYVIGHKTQAWMHVGRWWTMYSVVEKAMPRIQWIFTHWVNTVLGRVGMK